MGNRPSLEDPPPERTASSSSFRQPSTVSTDTTTAPNNQQQQEQFQTPPSSRRRPPQLRELSTPTKLFSSSPPPSQIQALNDKGENGQYSPPQRQSPQQYSPVSQTTTNRYNNFHPYSPASSVASSLSSSNLTPRSRREKPFVFKQKRVRRLHQQQQEQRNRMISTQLQEPEATSAKASSSPAGSRNDHVAATRASILSRNKPKKATFATKAFQKIVSAISAVLSFQLRCLGHLMRSLFLDLPVWICFTALLLTMLVTHFRDTYWANQYILETWNRDVAPRVETEYTYYSRQCTAKDQTAFDMADPDLLYQPDDTPIDAKNKMLKHGTTMYPGVLSPETAEKVRKFIVKQNRKQLDMIYVLNNENRYSFGIQVDQDPAVAEALSEILNNPRLVDALEAILGPDPAVIEFTGITATYGAKEQGMHADVIPEASAVQAARNFVPSYSLFIPLQNTTREMGATHICPGTHMCSSADFCDQTYLNAAGDGVWPAGWGALVNQQTQHRGAAHTAKDGLERVVFILTFAPRPRWTNKAVETRILGGGGSYSLHWSQWGHTLSDFANPQKTMGFPWRHLKSLGLYKPSGSHWGWDFWTVTFQRIAREELGYSGEEFLKADVEWIPEFLRGPMSLYKDYLNEESDSEYETVWEDFAYRVIDNVETFVQLWYPRVLGAVVSAMILANFLLVMSGRRLWVWRPLRRNLVGHIVIGMAIWLYRQRLEQSTWARNIRHNVSFNVHKVDYSHFPKLPSVLVNDEDILLTNEFQSDYLSTFAHVLDHSHRQNVWWRQRVQFYATQYQDLSRSLQQALCEDVLAEVSQQQARFLTKNSENGWAALTESLALEYIHKTLLSEANSFVGHAVGWTENLLSEYQFGYWRNNIALKKLGASFLKDLQSKLLNARTGEKGQAETPPKRYLGPKHEKLVVPLTMTRATTTFGQRLSLPKRPSVQPPRPSAWLKVGDTVEGKYRGRFDEWYKGTIVAAYPGYNTWEVEYDDGETDEGLCYACVRLFVPFQVGESVQYKDRDIDEYVNCRITRHADGTFDVELEDGETVYGVLESELRRGQGQVRHQNTVQWEEGDNIVSYIEDDEENRLFIGVIQKVLKSGRLQVRTMKGKLVKIDDSLVVGAVLELDEEGAVPEGTEVAARFPDAGSSLYYGTVSEALEGDMYAVDYEDGTNAVIERFMIASGVQ